MASSSNKKSTSIQLAPRDASVSEKRRVAALISWEKRRSRAGLAKKTTLKVKAKDVVKTLSNTKPGTMAAAVAITPPKGRKKFSTNTQTQKKTNHSANSAGAAPPPKRRRASGTAGAVSNQPKVYTSTDRSQAAKLGWERKRAQQTATNVRSQAAKIGWERRKNHRTSTDSRRRAAKLGRERRRGSPSPPSTANASSAEVCPTNQKKPSAAKKKSRRDVKASRSKNKSALQTKAKKLENTGSHKAQPKKETRQLTRGTKRSRRRSENPAAETARRARIVSFLRLSRGWMEFLPSSRHGAGTATYGYIPSSIASFVRAGTITQHTVLARGTLGVHYALDWDGYGGLKDMIATFGEDYSPFPNDEMMESSRVTEWELGDDLPWREVQKAEEEEQSERLRHKKEEAAKSHNKPSSTATNNEDGGDREEILFVANILASLDCDALSDDVPSRSMGLSQDTHGSCVGVNSQAVASPEADDMRTASSNIDSDVSPLHTDINKGPNKENGLSQPDSKEEKCKKSIQTRQEFKHWNFGF